MNSKVKKYINACGGFVGNPNNVKRYPSVLLDGNTVAWYDSQLLSTITKDGSNFISRWNDRLGSGHDLLQAVGTNQPKWFLIDGILFDGLDNFMKTAAFTLIQPEFIYIVFNQKTWTLGDRILDGNAVNLGMMYQVGLAPSLSINAGLTTAANNNLSLNALGIARICFNGASSSLQINETTKVIGNVGSNGMGGFTLGTRGDFVSGFGNIQVKEVIVRKVADGATDEATIYNYLSKKYGI